MCQDAPDLTALALVLAIRVALVEVAGVELDVRPDGARCVAEPESAGVGLHVEAGAVVGRRRRRRPDGLLEYSHRAQSQTRRSRLRISAVA